MTSSEHSSLKEVWKLLEQDNISIQSSNANNIESRSKISPGDSFQIVGVPITGNERDKPIKLPSSKTVIQNKRKKKMIRNYNDRS